MTVIVSLEGNIGAGKSTLIKKLQEIYSDSKDIIFLQEPVDEWINFKDSQGNNILECFYKNQEKYSFSFQMMAYITRLALIEKTIKENPQRIIFMERSLDTDKMVFAQMLFDHGKLEEIEFNIYKYWFDYFQPKEIKRKIIYLDVSPEICFDRIQQRAREGEEGITLEYLQKCHQYHEEMMKKLSFVDPILLIHDNDCIDQITSYL